MLAMPRGQAPRPSRRPRTPREKRKLVLRLLYPAASGRPPHLESRLLRPGEVALILQVSRRSVASWAAQGLIPFIETPGGHRRFRPADVRALVASLERPATVEYVG
jgi:excisionase family DNA binding protein